MIPKHFDAIEKTDIEALVENKVIEGRTIEYKVSLPGGSDGDKKEFLADVSSFANAGGGDLLFGVKEEGGLPVEVVGLDDNMDSEKLRLENLVRDSLEPRIPGLRMRPIDGFVKGPVLLIRVPRSWAAPHMLKFGKSTRFFTRNSAGKHQMDVTEIRAAFLLSEALPERVKRFRDERLGRIIADETPVAMRDGGKLILHILPVGSFTSETKFDVSVLKAHATNGTSKLRPIGSTTGWDERFNIDGFVTYSGARTGSGARSYSQIFRSGQIEAVSANYVREHEGKILIVPFEKEIVEAAFTYLDVLRKLEIPCPLFLFLSLTEVSGAYMSVNHMFIDEAVSVDRDTLILPDILIEDYASLSNINDMAKLLCPAFDAVWNACGYEGSHNYDSEENWNPRR